MHFTHEQQQWHSSITNRPIHFIEKTQLHVSAICEPPSGCVVNYRGNIIIITMARQPCMGLGLLFPRLLGLVHLWQWVTGPLAALFYSILMWLPEPSGKQSGELGEKWPLNFAYEHYWFYSCPKGSFTCRKSTTWDRRLYFHRGIIQHA
jgi:hypothetical protein